jgi:hypothetical protein
VAQMIKLVAQSEACGSKVTLAALRVTSEAKRVMSLAQKVTSVDQWMTLWVVNKLDP